MSSEFSSDESSENNLEDIQGAADDVLSYLEKIIYEMDVDASLEVSHNRRNIIIQIEQTNLVVLSVIMARFSSLCNFSAKLFARSSF